MASNSMPGEGAPQPDGFLRRNRVAFMIAGPVLLIVIIGVFWYLGRSKEVTDDAYVQAARLPISASIGGRVIELDVKENQLVKAGQVLFRIRPDDYTANVSAARAQLADARLRAQSLAATYRQQQLNIGAMQTSVHFTATAAARQRRARTWTAPSTPPTTPARSWPWRASRPPSPWPTWADILIRPTAIRP
jgi:multidrug resistance efflux pump